MLVRLSMRSFRSLTLRLSLSFLMISHMLNMIRNMKHAMMDRKIAHSVDVTYRHSPSSRFSM